MSAEVLLRRAREERCLLPHYWEEGADLLGREQLKLAKGLAQIKPAKVERRGRQVPCEPVFELRPKDRRRLVEALLADGVGEKQILATVPGLSARTFREVRDSDTLPAKTPPANGSSKRRIWQKRKDPVGRPWMAYRDATSGLNQEAEKAFVACVELGAWSVDHP